jgi:hypothetical protein
MTLTPDKRIQSVYLLMRGTTYRELGADYHNRHYVARVTRCVVEETLQRQS